MKSQIALIGIGLVIASGVAYAELKPASNTPSITTVATPDPTASESASTTPTQSKVATPKKSSLPMIAKPTISGGGDDDDDDEDEREDREHEDEDDD